MMAELTKQEISIGVDAYGRRVTMTRRKNYDGKILWQITSDPNSPRDEGERLDGLTDDNIRQMTQARYYGANATSPPAREGHLVKESPS